MRPSPAGAVPPPEAALPAWPSSTWEDSGVAAALEDYLAALREGKHPSRTEFLERHAHIAGPLGECLDGLEFVQSAALQLSSPDVSRATEEAIPPATCLGDFRVVRELGRGGMGIVYEAVQVSLGRRVALKVLPFASAIDPRQLRRFQIESQAAALLHHPHIVPVFAVGYDHGVHYYAMQFIEGRTLAEVIHGPKGAEAATAVPGPARGLSPSSLAELEGATSPPGSEPSAASVRSGTIPKARGDFGSVVRLGIQAAEALEHAHSMGVLHRDVKPANLMIDGRGDLWVTDFGLARFQEEVGLTRSGDLMGTLRYMSPEQIRVGAVVDQRTDIYSLGVTLYELSTLRPAFDGRTRHDIFRQLTQDDPVPPRRLVPGFPRDLETVILKAMAKEAEARYFSARELADDLRRFREDKPILARRPTPQEQAAKWMRRHRAAVIASASVLLVTISIAAGLLWREQRQTAHVLAELEALRERERAALPRIFITSASITMEAMGRVTELDNRDGLPLWNEPFFRKALGHYEGIIELARDDPNPAMRAILAQAYFGLGLNRLLLGQRGSAEAFSQSIAAYDALAAQGPDRAERRAELAESVRYYRKAIVAERGPAGAEPSLRERLAIDRALAASHPDSAEYRELFAQDLAFWAENIAQVGRRAEAATALREAIEANPQDPFAKNSLAWLLASRPDVPPHDPARALTLAKRAIELEPNVGAYWNTLGVAEYRMGLWDEAAKAFESSLSSKQGSEAFDWFFLAMVHARKGNADQARRLYDNAVAWTNQYAKQNPDLLHFRAEAEALLPKPEAS